MIKLGHHQPKSGFQSNHPKSRQIKGGFFFVNHMGRVVSGDCIDGAIFQPFDQRKPVRFSSEWWRHFSISVEFFHIFIGEGNMMGCRFSSDIHTFFFCLSDQFHRSGRGYMGNMQSTAGIFGNFNIPVDHGFFSQGGIAGESRLCGDHTLIHNTISTQGRVFSMVDNRIAGN